MSSFRVENVTLAQLTADAAHFAELFNEYGVLHLPGLLRGAAVFEQLVRDIQRLVAQLLARAGVDAASAPSLEAQINLLRTVAPTYPAYLYDMLTRPMKLLSGNLLKQHPAFVALAQHSFGPDALLASPFQSDNFLMVPPGQEADRFVLPIHQDFPYQMQSAQQLTFWLSLSEWTPGVGGVKVWPGSQRLGLCRCRKNANGHYEAQLSDAELAQFEGCEIAWNYGDVLVLHGLTLHQALPNRTADRTRLVQLFRLADVNTAESAAYFWQSNIYTRRGVSFAEAYPAYDLAAAQTAN